MFFVFFEGESMDIPGWFVFYLTEIKVGEELHGFLDFGSDVVGWFHDLSERGFNNNRSFWFMIIEDDVAGSKGSSHGWYKYDINIDIWHLFSCFFGLLLSFFGDLNIEVDMAELLFGILFAIGAFF